jgi:phosphatidylserine/phosphatidylglycerophosphate/cardiolipin synthase-like enzyme
MRALLLFAVACTGSAPTPVATTPEPPPPASTSPALVDPGLQLLVTPMPDHAPFVHAIDAATRSVDLEMFHLTATDVIDALGRAAGRKVRVRVILDGATLPPKKLAKTVDLLREAGVEVRSSTPKFSITHVKAMVLDDTTAFITAINLTKPVPSTRDFGVVTRVAPIVREVEDVFAADWDNAANQTANTPPLKQPSLVWSPINSRAKLTALIASATQKLDVTVENLGDPKIAEALAAAVKRRIPVRLIVPMCDKNPDPLHNFPSATKLAAEGISVRMMSAPESPEQPYMHSKMILADGAVAYVGSVNFSVNSTTKARELGIIFANPAAATTIAATFEQDWKRSVAIPSPPPSDCAAGE